MNYLIKQAFSLTSEEQAAIGITGIPQNWPIEKYDYVDQAIPDLFTVMTDVELSDLRYNNQAAYDSWLAAKAIAAPIPAPLSVIVSSAPAFGSKIIVAAGVTKKLYARNIGFQSALAAGANTITYTLAYPWVKMLGVEVINSEALDSVDLKVLDSAAGSYSGVPNLVLNQFAFATNLPKDYYLRMSNFDADLYVGMQIQITYTSVSAKTVGFNLLTNEVKT